MENWGPNWKKSFLSFNHNMEHLNSFRIAKQSYIFLVDEDDIIKSPQPKKKDANSPTNSLRRELPIETLPEN